MTPEPWLQRRQWHFNRIRSENSAARWATLLFAVLWNLMCIPIYVRVSDIRDEFSSVPATVFIVLFPAVGLVLALMAARGFYAWAKYGPTPLTLDPFPGALGGHVGGTVDTRIGWHEDLQCAVQLSCLYSFMRGSGKNRSRSERVKWQVDGSCETRRLPGGSRFVFRFDVPAGLPESTVQRSGNYHLWRVHLQLELDGVDYGRSFDIPVFATGEVSRDIQTGTELSDATTGQAVAGIENVARIRTVPGGVEVWYPALKRPLPGAVFVLFGVTFGGIGLATALGDGPLLLSIIFQLLGAAMLLGGTWSLGKALLVRVGPDEVRSRRFLFGIPLTTRRIPRSDLTGFRIRQGGSISSGRKHTIFYELRAGSRRDGRELVVAERLEGKAEANLVKEYYEAYAGD